MVVGIFHVKYFGEGIGLVFQYFFLAGMGLALGLTVGFIPLIWWYLRNKNQAVSYSVKKIPEVSKA